jgi:Protein of unknown function (DUF3631)
VVWRCDGPALTPRGFNVFCPKAFTGIGQHLHPTTLDRCIPILLERKLPADQIARFRQSQFEGEAAAIREDLTAWVALYGDRLGQATPALPKELDDRAQEIWEILLAIADLAGGPWPDAARQAAIELHAESDLEDLPLSILGRPLLRAQQPGRVAMGQLVDSQREDGLDRAQARAVPPSVRDQAPHRSAARREGQTHPQGLPARLVRGRLVALPPRQRRRGRLKLRAVLRPDFFRGIALMRQPVLTQPAGSR